MKHEKVFADKWAEILRNQLSSASVVPGEIIDIHNLSVTKKRRKKRSRRALLLPHACNPQTLKRPSTERLVSASAQQIGFRAWHKLGPRDLVIEDGSYVHFFLLLLYQTCSKTKYISLKFIYIIPRYNTYAFYTAVIPLAAWFVWNSSPIRTTSRKNIII